MASSETAHGAREPRRGDRLGPAGGWCPPFLSSPGSGPMQANHGRDRTPGRDPPSRERMEVRALLTSFNLHYFSSPKAAAPGLRLQQRNLGQHHSAQSAVPAPVCQCPRGAPHPALGVAHHPAPTGRKAGTHPSREQIHGASSQSRAWGRKELRHTGYRMGSARRGARGQPDASRWGFFPCGPGEEAGGPRRHPASVGEALFPQRPPPTGPLSTQLWLLPSGVPWAPQPAPRQHPGQWPVVLVHRGRQN